MADPQTTAALRAALDAALATRDRTQAVAAAVEAVESSSISIPDLYAEVLVPLMVDTGATWQAGSTRVWEEHYATATVRTIVEALYSEVVRAARDDAPRRDNTVLLACPPDEAHDLGLRMLSDRFEIAGWRTHFLGANTPVTEIVAAAKALRADLVVLSASTHYNRVLLRDVVAEVAEGLPGVKLVAGGAAFTCDTCDWPDDLLFDESLIEAGVEQAADHSRLDVPPDDSSDAAIHE